MKNSTRFIPQKALNFGKQTPNSGPFFISSVSYETINASTFKEAQSFSIILSIPLHSAFADDVLRKNLFGFRLSREPNQQNSESEKHIAFTRFPRVRTNFHPMRVTNTDERRYIRNFPSEDS